MRKLEIMPYDPLWVKEFEKEAQSINTILRDEIISIDHIGSTSVPGLYAKPIIDILLNVKDIHQIDHYNDQLSEIGYEARGENGISGRRYFQKGGDNRTHHIHMFEQGDLNIQRHIAFRDYLRNHPEEAHEYSKLKLKLTEYKGTTIEEYINGKDEFVKKLEKRALEWHENK